MIFLFILMISIKLYFYNKCAQIYKTETTIDFTDLEMVMLQALPAQLFVIGSILNLNYWIRFYLQIDKTVALFDGRNFDKKKYNNTKLILNIFTGVLIGCLLFYSSLLYAWLFSKNKSNVWVQNEGCILELVIGVAFATTGHF